MLSILIPVYNYDISNLVHDLRNQVVSAGIPFEILVYDDASDNGICTINRQIANLPHVKYKELDKNIGRAKIRNLLSANAQFRNLLFLDCDAKVKSQDFINRYLSFCDTNMVICGGVSYDDNLPNNFDQLRWQYGRKRECKPASIRNLKPNCSFTSFNFLISKDVFKRVSFNEHVISYGYEDTLFGFALKQNDIPVFHIDNTLIHTGIDSNQVFVNKSFNSVRTLRFIIQNGLSCEDLEKEVRILSYYNKIKSIGLRPVVKLFFEITHKNIENNLVNKGGNLLYYDMLRLGYLCSI